MKQDQKQKSKKKQQKEPEKQQKQKEETKAFDLFDNSVLYSQPDANVLLQDQLRKELLEWKVKAGEITQEEAKKYNQLIEKQMEQQQLKEEKESSQKDRKQKK